MAQLKFNSILVVCTGNICRSPIGERLLRKRLPGVKVKSAGVHGLVKHPADATAADVAANHGVSLEGHAGRKLTAEMARNYDLILAMESEHIAQVTAIAPEVKRRTKNAKAFHDKCENFSFRASNETAVLITAFYSLHGDHLGYG